LLDGDHKHIACAASFAVKGFAAINKYDGLSAGTGRLRDDGKSMYDLGHGTS
jgi:hypothetical protein